MAMRAMLRCAASRSWRSRSVNAVDTCSRIFRDCESKGGFSGIACSSASSAGSQFLFPKSHRLSSSWICHSSRSVSGFLHSLSLSSPSASEALRMPSHVSSYLSAGPSVAHPCSYSASSRRSIADLRLGNVAVLGAQEPGGANLALWTSMQQRRNLSKLKKYKMKSYSSYKKRFKLMSDGTYKRWRSGTRHNAHSKTAKQRRQLRRPSIAPAALATVMKKLHFVG